jgi:DNA-binding SARP family transcriptional activator/WD40 repeat protein
VFLRVLGPLVVEVGDPPVGVAVPGAKERAVLGRLLVSPGRAVPVDVLVEDVWSGRPPPTARRSLQAHVVRLRTSLEPERPTGSPGQFVARRGDAYALAVSPESVDVGAAAVAASAARAARAAGDLPTARRGFEAALAYWRGEPFEDWRTAGWADGERRRLADVQGSTLEARIDVDLDLGRHRELVAELEALVAADPLREGWWIRLMLALYRSDRQADALAAGRRARAYLVEELGVDPGPALARTEQVILHQTDDLLPPLPGPVDGAPAGALRAPRPAATACPYRGLAAYEPADADLFHGRSLAVRALTTRLRATRLVVVSGPSGVGKSSIVGAGLVPELVGGAVPHSAGAEVVVVKPGSRPVDELAPLLRETETADRPPGSDRRPVALIVDQFEQLWTAGTEARERVAFVDAVLAMLDDGLLSCAVLVVRGDYLGRLAEHAELARRAADGLVLVPPMTEPELREVVEEPARAAGLEVDPDLVDAVIRDMHGQAAALPLLSSALVGTWERRRERLLTLTGYLEAGGVTGAMACTAEGALAAVDTADTELVRRIFVRLASSGGEDDAPTLVRRRVPLAELGLEDADGARRRAVIEEFVSRRLLTIDGGHLEVTHEALLTGWPRLATWLGEDSLGRAVRAHLAPEAADWAAAGRPTDRLYRGARLHSALEWLARPDADPTPAERDFLRASSEHAEAELAAARNQVRREQAGRRRTRRLAVVLALATVVALAGGLLAAQGKRAADANALRADADRLAAASSTVGTPDLSLLLAAQAYRTQHTPQTEAALLSAAVEHRKIVGVYRAAGIAQRLAASPDGHTVYAHTDGQVVAWDATTHQARVLADHHSSAADPRDIAASPAPTGDTAGLVAAVTPPVPGAAGSALTLLGPDGRVRWTRGVPDLGGWPLTAQFTADGQRLGVVVVAGYGGPTPVRSVRYVDSRTGRAAPPVFTEHVRAGEDTDGWRHGFSADALTVDEFADSHPEVIVTRDLSRGTTTRLNLPIRAADGVNLLAAGRGWLVTVADGTAYWYPPGATRPAQRMAEHTSWVSAAATDAAGSVLVTAADQRLVVSDLVEGRWVRREVLPAGAGTVHALAVNREGTRAYSSGDDGTVTAWDLTDRQGFGAQIRTPRVAGVDPSDLIVIGDPELAARTGEWVVPVMQWSTPASQGPIFAVFVDPRTREAVGKVRASVRAPVGWPRQTASVSPDGRLVAITTGFSTAVIDIGRRQVVHQVILPTVPEAAASDGETLRGIPEPVAASAWTADGRSLLLATGGARQVAPRGAVVVVDTATWSPVSRVLPPGNASAIAVSPDGRVLAVGYDSGDVHLADAGTYRVTHRLHVNGNVRAVAFSDDGARLAAVGGSRRLDVWDPRSGEEVLAGAPSFAGAGVSVRWLPGTHTAVYGGEDGQAALYDTDAAVQRGVSLPVFADAGAGDVQIAPVTDRRLALFPGWRFIGQTREGVVYPLEAADWLAHACSIVRRDLSRAEWNVYLPGRPYRPTCGES